MADIVFGGVGDREVDNTGAVVEWRDYQFPLREGVLFEMRLRLHDITSMDESRIRKRFSAVEVSGPWSGCR